MLTCLTVFQSCKKLDENNTIATPVQTTMSVELKANQTYTYTLPLSNSKQIYRVVKSSLHNASTAITVDASGNMQLVYTPALDFAGTDAIALTTTPADSCKANHPPHHGEHKSDQHPAIRLPFPHKHKCEKQDKPLEHNILINFNISSDETITSVN